MRVARLAIDRPRLVLAVWLALVGLLALKGLGVEDRLHRGAITVPGAAERANEAGERAFGEGVPLTILLQGPRRALDREGRELTAAIARIPEARLLSPWTTAAGTSGGALRPRRDRALVIVRQNAPFERQSRKTVPQLRALMREHVDAPVRAHLTGAPDVANGIQKASLDALGRAEVIAAPLLLLVLLLVFRSPVAAAIPLLLGLMTIAAARGVIDLVNHFIALDSLALSIASTLGLALGVDYSLLVVSRFREELAAGSDVRRAATIAAQRAGHTVFVAGLALLAAVAISLLLAPGSLLASATTGAMVAGVLTVSAAITVLPAVLMLIGTRVDRWRFGSATSAGRGAGIALAALRRPLVAALAVGGLLAALAAPALGLQTGPPDVRGLPAKSTERQDYEAIRTALGGGWMAPFDVFVIADKGPITAPQRLRQLERFQASIARLREVDTVVGPAALKPVAKQLAAIPRELGKAQKDQKRLASGMRRVRAGVGQLRDGLDEAATGAEQLRAGGSQADAGAEQLERGLAAAQRGAGAVVTGLESAGDGAGELADGVGAALRGVRQLASGVDELRDGAAAGGAGAAQLASGLREGRSGLAQLREPAQIADRELQRALKDLDGMLATSKLDPAYRRIYEAVGTASAAVNGRDPRNGQRVREGYDGLDAALATAATRLDEAVAGAERLRDGLRRLGSGLASLDTGVGQLRAGIGRLRAGAEQLQGGLRRLRSGGGDLTDGLARLRRGAGALDSGTGQLAGGAAELADGLNDGAARSGELSAGVTRISDGVASSRALGTSDQLIRVTRSGHMLLAAVDSAPRRDRDAAGLIVNLERGGSAANITVVAKHDPSHAGEPLRGRLEQAAERFTERTGLRAHVGGSAPVFQDFDKVSSERLPLLILGLVVLTYFALVAIFRSLVLPAIAVLLNAATVLAAFGVLALTFQGDDPLLGGPGFLDAISVFGTLSVVYGLSIDYAVFLISRMREGYALTGTTEGAVTYAINGTARIITGAAAIMSGVFLALAVSDVSNLRQLGVGLSVAVMLDATLVRLVLLPALVKLAGPAAWWWPSRLHALWPPALSPAAPDSSGPTSATSS